MDNNIPVQLLAVLQEKWPAWLPPVVVRGEVRVPAAHSLDGEVRALCAGRTASLPHFPDGGDTAAWCTLAPDADRLRQALEDLHAWVLPSFGWEDPRGWLVLPGTAAGGLSGLLLGLSPAGYCRWRTGRDAAAVRRVADKLRQARELEEGRPRHVLVRVPSLLELRQEFAAALAAGDRAAALDAVARIDRYQLDTADNTLFMRVRLWDQFGEASPIVEHPQRERLISLRMPQRIRLALARAFHAYFLAALEPVDLEAARKRYAESVHEVLAGLLDFCEPADGPEMYRLLAYRAAYRHDGPAAEALVTAGTDAVVAALLGWLVQPLLPSALEPPASPEERFFEARRRGDWRAVQELGEALLGDSPEVAPILWKSLQYQPNATLEQRLAALAPQSPPALAPGKAVVPRMWAEWLDRVCEGPAEPLEAFLEERTRTDPARLGSGEVQRLVDALTGAATDPRVGISAAANRLLLAGLAELVGDFINEPRFPRPELADLYRALLVLWGERKKGSALPPDGQILLELGEAQLQLHGESEGEVAAVLRGWWEARPVKALLPFMLGAVELFDRLGSKGQAEVFWVLAGEFVRGRLGVLTPGERLLWRQVGRRIGYGDDLLDEYVPLPPEAERADPIRQAQLGKVVIVSLRERQARAAAELLAGRTDAEVVCVTDTHTGAGMAAALTADVILLVWSAMTHAVFRGFDRTDRRKIAYVQGTSAASIVLALERWAADVVSSRGISAA